MILTVPEVLALNDNEIVPAVGGIFHVDEAHATDQREDGGAFTYQKFKLSGYDAVISGIIYDHGKLDEYDNTEVVLASMKSKNGRFGGVSIKKIVSKPTSLFSRKTNPPISLIRVSKAGGFHTPDTFQTLCATTKRPKFNPDFGATKTTT